MVIYDLHMHSRQSIGENSTEEMAQMAKRLGIDGIGVCRFFGTKADLVWEIPADDIDFVKVIILKPKTAGELEKLAAAVRNNAEVVAVYGGNYDINRAACENSMVDVLFHPELGRNDSGLDHICARAAAENNVAIEINFREIAESYKKHRAYVLSFIRRNIRLCQKYGVPVITTSGAHTKWGLRSGRELAAVSHLLGIELSASLETVSAVPEAIVSENRKKLGGKKWEGVSIVGE
ncbi:MAG: hypothetical protein HZB66_03565 [Candidatus Aenigmarchaeota archaeon]|nr:hypothetical protein [Candidatus Aenigmarchaeota archaeon]